MASRISPLIWPLLARASPVLVPKMLRRNRTFKENRSRAESLNRQRIDEALALDLPELEFLELTVLVDEKTANGFRGDPGVSYLIKTDWGTVLFDVGFGPGLPTLSHNANKLGLDFSIVQMFFGTGKPPWQRISDDDLNRTIANINEAGPKRVLLSAHDTCDHALCRMADELNAETVALKAGKTCRL